ncbi:MAG: ATP-binding protein [Bacteroidales bacterium]|jgi:hypothetical protein|nr:ATP-binding protein [Bacteroidales bacterium]
MSVKKAYSIKNVINTRFKTIEVEGQWKAAIGTPELSGSWFIYGAPKNGKTSFAMKLAKYLTQYKRVAYNSVEEGLSLSIQNAMKRENMLEVGGKMILLEKEDTEAMIKRLSHKKSPDIIFLDSVQFAELTFADYKKIKTIFKDKLFIYISHVEGRVPEGRVARRIWRDANIAIRVEGFCAFPVGRFGGGKPIIISKEKAEEYWGVKLENLMNK